MVLVVEFDWWESVLSVKLVWVYIWRVRVRFDLVEILYVDYLCSKWEFIGKFEDGWMWWVFRVVIGL